MDLLVSDGGERGDHHVEPIEPGPAFNKVKARHPDQGQKPQRDSNQPQIAESFHDGR